MDEDVPASEDKKPPPIFIKIKINDFSSFCTNIKRESNPQPNLHAKVQQTPSTSNRNNKFLSISYKISKRKNVDFYTCQLKDEKAYRIVIRNLHPSTKIEFIKEKFRQNGHIARNITNVLQNLTKIPLPLFFIDLKWIKKTRKRALLLFT
jgi:hypothetical protein